MVGSRCVVQGCDNRSNRAAGVALHSPTEKTRDVWLRFMRTKRKNFNPKPGTRFVICSVHFEESCFTRPFHPSQRRQVWRGSLPSIWKRSEQKTARESERNRRMREKERQKVSVRNACAVVLAFVFPVTLINSHTNCSNYTCVFNVLVSSITTRQAKMQTTFPNHRSLQNKIRFTFTANGKRQTHPQNFSE